MRSDIASLSPRFPSTVRRFWGKVDSGPQSECWEWKGWVDKDGYGRIGNGANWPNRAPRFSWFLHYGEIPEGRVVRHRCDNPACVNPVHLELGTPADNTHDRDARGRTRKGQKHHNAVLTTEQAYEIRALTGQGWVHQDIADAYGVAQSTVSRIARREAWGHLQEATA